MTNTTNEVTVVVALARFVTHRQRTNKNDGSAVMRQVTSQSILLSYSADEPISHLLSLPCFIFQLTSLKSHLGHSYSLTLLLSDCSDSLSSVTHMGSYSLTLLLSYSLHSLTLLLSYSLTPLLPHSLSFFWTRNEGPRTGSRQRQHSTAVRITVIIYTIMTN